MVFWIPAFAGMTRIGKTPGGFCRVFCLVIVMAGPASWHPAHAGEAYLDDLMTRARAARLADEPQWRALVHYRPNLIFPGVTGQADDPGFYLAPHGKTDPQAELEATLASFFAPAVIETDRLQHPQCRFIARYHWLRDRLDFDPERLPPQPCARFDAWRSALNAKGLTLVFPSAYLNNPSSMFGHTLLRVDAADQDERTRLLAYAINYAVNPGPDGGPRFILKSLIGSYPGLFSMSPYYVKVKEYSDLENRDIWEYRLNFTQEEIDRLLEHAWELGQTRFDYYFFDENCAYHLLSLFEVARPSLRLTSKFRGWAIPVDTVRRVVGQGGLLAGVTYRPAANTRLRHRLARMSAADRALARRLAAGEDPTAVLTNEPQARRAEILEGAYGLVRYEASNGGDPRADHAALSRELLVARSRVPIQGDEGDPPAPSVRPDQGHRTQRVSLGVGREAGDDFETVAYRPAYNDLLDPAGGYTEGAQIDFLNVDLRRYDHNGSVQIERLDLVDIDSLAPSDEVFRPVSWRFDTGLARTRIRCDDRSLVYRNRGGAGLAWGSFDRGVVYGFLEGSVDVGGVLDRDYAIGAGPAIGLYIRPMPAWKVNLFARLQEYRLGDRHHEREVSLQTSLSLGHQQALRLELGNHRERGIDWNGAKLVWQRYF
jgi:hypothetical protein